MVLQGVALVGGENALIRLDLCEMLAELGYQPVVPASLGLADILAAVATLRPRLIVIETTALSSDALAVASNLTHTSCAPVILVTAAPLPAPSDVWGTPGLSHLAKPFGQTDLLQAIDRVCR